MQLYVGTGKSLVEESTYNRIAATLSEAFFRAFRFQATASEVNSWRNSIRAISQVFERGGMFSNGVILELQLPLSSLRLDCMITGFDHSSEANALIIELKQWDKCSEAAGKNEVATWLGGTLKDVLHPSAQVGQYRNYLQDCHTAFYGDERVNLSACSYLHNYSYQKEDALLSSKFDGLIAEQPVFSSTQVDELIGYIRSRVPKGDEMELVKRIGAGRYAASKKLLDHVSAVIKGKSEYVLLDEQLVVYDSVLQLALGSAGSSRKNAVIIKGGPGTGKSVVALKLLGDLSGQGLNTHYVTGSRAFTKTIREIVGTKASAQLKYTDAYKQADENVVDVMVCDEAHRIRLTSNTWLTPKDKRSKVPQIRELLAAAKTCVFLLDDDQLVRPDEIGSAEYIRAAAEQFGCQIAEFELEAQFRCLGSDGFVNWINNTLGIHRTANVMWSQQDEYDFRIFDSPLALEEAIHLKAGSGATARLAAGFCWKWSDPNSDGSLVDDIEIGEYKRPWNARSGKGRLASGIPPESLWAYRADGIQQVGCVYTAQGFEFDYVGVIFGPDLVYDARAATWRGNPERSADKGIRKRSADFLKLVKNTYRVLLTRGMKGCYVYFMDKPTENFFRSRME
jgi:DUF2075 family protein